MADIFPQDSQRIPIIFQSANVVDILDPHSSEKISLKNTFQNAYDKDYDILELGTDFQAETKGDFDPNVLTRSVKGK